jgi:hypothetical protein
VGNAAVFARAVIIILTRGLAREGLEMEGLEMERLQREGLKGLLFAFP